MPATPIRVITFDWGDTLATNWSMPYQEAQRRAFARLAADLAALGGTIAADFAQRCMAEQTRDWKSSVDPAQNPENRELDLTRLMAGWIASAGVDPVAAAPAVARCWATQVDTVLLFAEVAPALADLKQRGYRLGILSHVPWPGDACRAWFVRHGIAQHLDFYSFSSDVGWIKPHPAHYQDVVRQAGCAANEILHVGDHPERDIAGGQRFGFRTCLRHTEGIYAVERLAACTPDASILHLDEVAAVAERLSHGG